MAILWLMHLIVPAHRAQQVLLARMVPMAQRVLQVLPAQWDHKALKASLEPMALTVPPARQDHKAPLEPMARQAQPVLAALLARLALLEVKVVLRKSSLATRRAKT